MCVCYGTLQSKRVWFPDYPTAASFPEQGWEWGWFKGWTAVPSFSLSYLSSELTFASRLNLYWNPEQPPPSTVTLSSVSVSPSVISRSRYKRRDGPPRLIEHRELDWKHVPAYSQCMACWQVSCSQFYWLLLLWCHTGTVLRLPIFRIGLVLNQCTLKAVSFISWVIDKSMLECIPKIVIPMHYWISGATWVLFLRLTFCTVGWVLNQLMAKHS